jgi:hypothetical protein
LWLFSLSCCAKAAGAVLLELAKPAGLLCVRAKLISASKQFHMLGGEVLVHQQDEVELLTERQRGNVFLTNYRLVFVPCGSSTPDNPLPCAPQSVPLGCVAQVDLHYNVMRVVCKVGVVAWRNSIRGAECFACRI